MWLRMSAGNHIFNNFNKVMYIAYADMRIVILWDKHPVMLKPYMIITQRRFPIKSTSLLHSELRLGIVLFPGVVCREQSKFRFGVHFSFKVQARVVVMGTARQRGQVCRPQLHSKMRLRHNKQMHQMCENNQATRHKTYPYKWHHRDSWRPLTWAIEVIMQCEIYCIPSLII